MDRISAYLGLRAVGGAKPVHSDAGAAAPLPSGGVDRPAGVFSGGDSTPYLQP